jgi:hypothetical protein
MNFDPLGTRSRQVKVQGPVGLPSGSKSVSSPVATSHSPLAKACCTGGVSRAKAFLPVLSIKVRARLAGSVVDWQWYHASVKHFSRDVGSLGVVVVVVPVVFAVINPQYVCVGAGVDVGGGELECGVLVATGWDVGVDVAEVTVAVAESCAVVGATVVPLNERSLQPVSKIAVTTPMNSTEERRHIRFPPLFTRRPMTGPEMIE